METPVQLTKFKKIKKQGKLRKENNVQQAVTGNEEGGGIKKKIHSVIKYHRKTRTI